MANFCLGALAGFFLYHWLVHHVAMYRTCCRQHYRTHATCPCGDCANQRAAEQAEEHEVLK
jgi:hypothetical protein